MGLHLFFLSLLFLWNIFFCIFSQRNNASSRAGDRRPALSLYDQFRPKPGENRPRSVDMRYEDARVKTAYTSTTNRPVESRPRKDETKSPGEIILIHSVYSNHLNTGLVRYSNGRFVSGCQMVYQTKSCDFTI